MDGANGKAMAQAGKPLALPCRVDANEVLRYLGYRGQTLDDDLRKRFDTAASLCERELQAAGMFAIFPLSHAEERMREEERTQAGERAQAEEPSTRGSGGTQAKTGATEAGGTQAQTEPSKPGCAEARQRDALEGALPSRAAVTVETPAGRLELPGRAIARHLRGCGEVALMAVTLGAKSEMLLRRETALSATDGMLADVCASSAVEQAADVLNEQLRAQAKQRGLATTWRFSPGYGDLPLSVQPDFLKVLGADKALGISLTPALMLVPAKTITAIVGLYRPEDRPRAGAGSQGEALNSAKPEAGHGKKAAGRPEADAFGRTEAGESREATAPAGATCPGARPREAKGTEDGMPS
uniref:AdoMet activation domain-containing protein n=1 Tax=Muribaculaceae bacterium Z82 TaxID=2304548 RepID=A0A7C9NU54_9BACT